MPVGRSRLRVVVSMLERAAEPIINKYRHDERNASHGKAIVVSLREFLNVGLTEGGCVARKALSRLQRLQRGCRLRRHACRIVQILMGQSRNLRVICEAVHAQHIIGHLRGRRRSKKRADVDGHVEKAERSVALVLVLRRVIEVAHHHLQVALEQSRAASNQRQRTKHHRLSGHVRSRGDGQQQIAYEHDEHAQRHHLAEPVLVRQDAAQERHEIDGRQERRENGGGVCGRIAELRLQEQGENGEHRVIPEPLARVGQSQRVKTFWLSFKHNRKTVFNSE